MSSDVVFEYKLKYVRAPKEQDGETRIGMRGGDESYLGQGSGGN